MGTLGRSVCFQKMVDKHFNTDRAALRLGVPVVRTTALRPLIDGIKLVH